jgi:hypothetical protein
VGGACSIINPPPAAARYPRLCVRKLQYRGYLLPPPFPPLCPCGIGKLCWAGCDFCHAAPRGPGHPLDLACEWALEEAQHLGPPRR